jgi:GTP-binding protein
MSDPAYPGQWRVSGAYIEQIAKMTHWEYPEAIERFGRQLEALGISAELERRGAMEGDLVMVDKFDFDFSPGMTNPYIPKYLLEEEMDRATLSKMETLSKEEVPWLPFGEGGYLNVDTEELLGFDAGDWELLDDELDEDDDESELVLKDETIGF